jgi:hypothetical protein
VVELAFKVCKDRKDLKVFVVDKVFRDLKVHRVRKVLVADKEDREDRV